MSIVTVHAQGDSVGVAAEDLDKGDLVTGRSREHDDYRVQLEVRDHIPLGQKVALVDIHDGEEVIEYGNPIGVATSAIKAGQHVHIHNMKGKRWD